MFFGPGAGAGPTASAVVSDILNIAGIITTTNTPHGLAESAHPLMTCTHQHYCELAPIEELITRFYARFITRDLPGVIGKLGTCFGNHEVSIESIVQIDTHGKQAEIVVVTHDVREGNFRAALEELKHMDIVDRFPSLLRVL
ncbi:homoserine dehydrogenase [Limnospira platensis C1]|nr:homoserine dehydrogenase [Arthrospira platensis C1]